MSLHSSDARLRANFVISCVRFNFSSLIFPSALLTFNFTLICAYYEFIVIVLPTSNKHRASFFTAAGALGKSHKSVFDSHMAIFYYRNRLLALHLHIHSHYAHSQAATNTPVSELSKFSVNPKEGENKEKLLVGMLLPVVH